MRRRFVDLPHLACKYRWGRFHCAAPHIPCKRRGKLACSVLYSTGLRPTEKIKLHNSNPLCLFLFTYISVRFLKSSPIQISHRSRYSKCSLHQCYYSELSHHFPLVFCLKIKKALDTIHHQGNIFRIKQ